MLALQYYQVVEMSLRIEVVNDSPWYAPCLQQAIEGQDRTRAFMDKMGVNLATRYRMILP